MTKVIFIGAGQYAEVVSESLPRKYKLVGFIDEGKTGTLLGKPILGKKLSDVAEPKKYKYFVAFGEIEPRRRWFKFLQLHRLEVINIIDKSAKIAKDVKMGIGNYVGKNVVINKATVIGNDNMFNTASVIEHHCKIGSHVRIAPTVSMCGVVKVGDSVFIGSNATIVESRHIGEGSVIGAGAVVIKDVEPYTTVVGVPAKEIKRSVE